MSQPLRELETIRTPEALADLCRDLQVAGRFALDTEFVGERTYLPRLCFVQVATEEFIALVDTLAVSQLDPLWDLVVDPNIETILHAAREDLRLSYYGSGKRLPRNIFDTQVAAGFIGLPAYPLSYARLAEALMGVKLSKAETRSEWDRRPLTPAQLEYARDDVRYLLPITDKIKRLLGRMNRTEWMQEEMGRFSEARTYEVAPEEAYLRLRTGRGFTARPTALLRAVASWREQEAQDRDIPARSLLRDEVLIELAQRPPRRLTDFRRLRGFPEVEEVTFGAPLLEALNTARALPEEALPSPLSSSGPEETPRERVLGDLLYGLGEALCLERNLAPELTLTKADALAAARGQSETSLLSGWRRTAVGGELEQIAAGRASVRLQVTPDSLSVLLNSEIN
ncbi:MAG: ribonuclease D [Janthinobacterium lividum]